MSENTITDNPEVLSEEDFNAFAASLGYTPEEAERLSTQLVARVTVALAVGTFSTVYSEEDRQAMIRQTIFSDQALDLVDSAIEGLLVGMGYTVPTVPSAFPQGDPLTGLYL